MHRNGSNWPPRSVQIFDRPETTRPPDNSSSRRPPTRAVPTTPPECFVASVRFRRRMLSSFDTRDLDLRGYFLVGAPVGSLALRPGDSLTIPRTALSIGFRTFGFPPVCNPSYGASDSCPGGTDSHWTRQPLLDALVSGNPSQFIMLPADGRSSGARRDATGTQLDHALRCRCSVTSLAG